MFDLLAFAFVQRGMVGAVVVGGVCSMLGVFVVLRGMSYIGTGIAHGCLAGVALALLLGWNPLVTAIVSALLMIGAVELISGQTTLKMDTSIGVVFSVAMALAVLFIGMQRSYTPDIMGYLFGNLLAVTWTELCAMATVGAVTVLVMLAFFKELQFSTFDPEMAEVCGIPARATSLMLSILMGLTIVISLRAVGELLVLALIVLPASTAYQVTCSLRKMIVFSVALGVVSSLAGLIAAFYLDVPTGSTIVILLGSAFTTASVVRRMRETGRGRHHHDGRTGERPENAAASGATMDSKSGR